MQTVYRIEHTTTGQGPYTSGSDVYGAVCRRSEFHQMMADHGPTTHPSWEEDGLTAYQDTAYRAGFKDYAQLCEWFDGLYFNVIMQAGFRVLEYPACNVVHGNANSQVVFLQAGEPVDVTVQLLDKLASGWRHWHG